MADKMRLLREAEPGLGVYYTVGAEIITNTTLGVPYYNYTRMGRPETLF